MNSLKDTSQKSKEDQGQKGILLSVVVSCMARKAVLEKNLQALSRQNLNLRLWELLFVFHEGQNHSDCIPLIESFSPSPRILFGPKDQPIYEMRNLGLNNASGSLIYFIDEDVILSDKRHLGRLLEFHKARPNHTVIGGGYLNAPGCSFWGKSYNHVALMWIKNHPDFIPAGNLSVKMEKKFKARFYSPNPFGFGGEEICFLKSLKGEGHKILLDETLSVRHLARHGFWGFIKRAWIHGAGLAFEKQPEKSSYFLFFREPADLSVKIASFFYLLLVRLSWLFYKLKMLL